MNCHPRTMSKRKNGCLLALVLMTLAIGSLTPNSACAQHAPVSPINDVAQADAQTDMVLDWNDHAVNEIVGIAGQRPERGLIRLAMVHVAIYDAVNAIDGHPFQSYGVTPNVVSPASREAATAAAAHDMLVALFPARLAELDAHYAASLATTPACH